MQHSSKSIPATGALWQAMARQWALLASPVRPCAQDIRLVAEVLGAETNLFTPAENRRVWLLGVTPELAEAECLQGLEMVAVDRVRAMIDAVWPGDSHRRRAVCADWLRAPFADESFDLVIGDGCLTHVAVPEGVASLLASVHRCLRPGGFLLLRQFCPPDAAELPAAVIAALRSGSMFSSKADTRAGSDSSVIPRYRSASISVAALISRRRSPTEATRM